MANHLEALGNVLELFGDIFAELPQLAAAIGAAVAGRSVGDDFAWQDALGAACVQGCVFGSFAGVTRSAPASSSACAVSSFFQLKFQLLELDDDLLALGAEDHMRGSFSTISFRCSICSLRERSSSVLFGECLAMGIELGFKTANLSSRAQACNEFSCS